MNKLQRLILFAIFAIIGIVVLVLNYFYMYKNEEALILLLTTYILACAAAFITENFFTKPTDVIVSGIMILLIIFPIKNNFSEIIKEIVIIFSVFIGLLIIFSVLTLLLVNKEKSPDYNINKYCNHIKNIVCTLGNSCALYTILFSILIVHYMVVDNGTKLILVPLLFILYILSTLNTKKDIFYFLKNVKKNEAIANIISIDNATIDNNVIVAKLYDDYNDNIEPFTPVILQQADDGQNIKCGIVIEKISLAGEQRLRILTFDNYNCKLQNNLKIEKNIIYKYEEEK